MYPEPERTVREGKSGFADVIHFVTHFPDDDINARGILSDDIDVIAVMPIEQRRDDRLRSHRRGDRQGTCGSASNGLIPQLEAMIQYVTGRGAPRPVLSSNQPNCSSKKRNKMKGIEHNAENEKNV